MRIGIVNDVALAREALRRVVESTGEHEVAWLASDGAEALAFARVDRPDVILMDLVMPGMDGVEATRRIMGEAACPILIVTATVSGHLNKVYQAMGYGALDAVDTPVLGPRGELEGGSVLLHKLHVIERLAGKKSPGSARNASPVSAANPRLTKSVAATPLVVLGASTGGPQALAEILSGLPKRLPAAVIVVQHVDSAFAPGLSKWLAEQTNRPVSLISEGRAAEPGEILLSSTDDHLVVGTDGKLRYTPEPRDASYRPSIDVFFHSLARAWPRAGVAALLTGMGRDGAEGLLALRRQGWRTIAQDEATSVVWGMPKAAAQAGAAEHVLPLFGIAQAITRFLGSNEQALQQASWFRG